MAQLSVLVIDARALEAGVTPGSEELRSWKLGILLECWDSQRDRALLSFSEYMGCEPREPTKPER